MSALLPPTAMLRTLGLLDALTPFRPKFMVAAGAFTVTGLIDAGCRVFGPYAPVCADMVLATEMLQVLILLQLLDTLSGLAAARVKERVISRKLMTGMTRKIFMLLIVVAGFLLDRVIMGHGIETSYLIYKWSASWYIAVETLSIYENARILGVPFPPVIVRAVEWLLDQSRSADPIGARNPKPNNGEPK